LLAVVFAVVVVGVVIVVVVEVEITQKAITGSSQCYLNVFTKRKGRKHR
jgi:hypothetical protein